MKSVKSRRCSYITNWSAVKHAAFRILTCGVNSSGTKTRGCKILISWGLTSRVKNSLTTRDLRSRGCKILISWGPRSRGTK